MSDRTTEQDLRVICHYCETINDYGERFCESCRGLLERGRTVTLQESIEYAEKRERRAAQRQRFRRGRYILAFVVLATIVAVVAVWLSRTSPALPDPQSSISIQSAAGQWPAEGFDVQNTRTIDGSHSPLSGSLIWQSDLNDSVVGSPVVADNAVYMALESGRIIGLNIETGEVVWELDGLGRPGAAPTIAGDTIYLGLNVGQLLAIDRDSRQVRWSAGPLGGIIAPPTVSNGEVLIGTNEKTVVSLDAATGEERWRHTLDGVVAEPLSVSGETAVAVTFTGVHFFDLRSGHKQFSYATYVSGVVGPAVIRDDAVYYVWSDGIVQALDLQPSGLFGEKTLLHWWGQLWIWGMAPRPPSPRGLIWSYHAGAAAASALAVSDRAVYLGTRNGRVVAIDRGNPRPLWSYQTEGRSETAPAVMGDTVYTASGRYVYALNATTGELLWRFAMTDTAACNVTVTPQVLVTCDRSGNIYAIG